jgi:hypothetical protein
MIAQDLNLLARLSVTPLYKQCIYAVDFFLRVYAVELCCCVYCFLGNTSFLLQLPVELLLSIVLKPNKSWKEEFSLICFMFLCAHSECISL